MAKFQNVLFRNFPAAIFFLFPINIFAQQPDDPVEIALNTLTESLGEVFLGTPKAEFLDLKKSAARIENADFREIYFEKIDRDGIADLTYYFEKKSADQFLYEIIVGFSDEKLCAPAIRRDLGEPNFPGKPGQWVLSAVKNDPVVSIAWELGNKFILAINLPGSEWEGSEKFILPADFDLSSLPGADFAPPFPEELENEPVEKARFFEVLENQIEAATDNFQKLRGTLMGEPGSGVIGCKTPLNLAEMATISQDDAAKWQLCNYLAAGLDEAGSIEYLRQLVEILTKNPLKNHFFQPAGKTNEDGFEETIFEILSKKGKLTDTQLVIVRGFYEDEGGWAIDLNIVKF